MSSISAETIAQQYQSIELKIVNPTELYDPVPNGYSHAVVAKGGGRIAYIAGQGGEDKSGALSTKFSEQVKQAYQNMLITLQAMDAKPNQVTKITTYVVDYNPSLLEEMTKQVKMMFGDALPAQTLVPVPRLALDGMLFEVDAIVILDD
ncbi:Rid family hydrolase [Paraglaciecola sp.]|uniref:RidA family protein n=1 Tax=Paraglaciecola sp. TaxID=1920173 RepID=UPI0030F37E37